MKHIKFIRIFLLVLIIIGTGLLATQKIWVPKVIDMILGVQNNHEQKISIVPQNKANTGKTIDFHYPIPPYQITFPGKDEWLGGFIESRDTTARSKFTTLTMEASSTNRNLSFILMTNMNGEVSPRFSPPFSSCVGNKEVTYLGTKVVSTVSSLSEDGDACGVFGTMHAMRMTACVDNNQNVFKPKTTKGTYELYLDCGANGTLFSFDLLCDGNSFAGSNGREECANIFNEITSGLKILNE